jgi:excisionase family DNA binding protein
MTIRLEVATQFKTACRGKRQKDTTMQETLCQSLANTNFYLNVNDVAELLGVQRETIYRYCRENFLPHTKIGNTIRVDPRLLAIWIQEHEFAACGNVTDKITDWVVAHVLDRTLNLPVPDQLTKVLAGLSEHWLADALRDQAQDLASDCYSQPLRTFQAELNRQLSLAEQRELLAELLWLGIHCA